MVITYKLNERRQVFTNLLHILKSDLFRVIGHGYSSRVRNGSYDCKKKNEKKVLVLPS